ncbi:MAG: TetR/AcrR family transcriptional regulator [Novosphingobium sp.]
MKPARTPAEPAASAPRRAKGVSKNPAEARRKLIAAAIALFAEKGFAATSTEEVAERAGYGQATVFFHFKTKAGLLEACFAATLERARAALLPACQSGTLALVRRLDQSYDDGPQADFFARMMSELAGNAKFGPIYAAFHGQLRDLIEAELMRETGAPQPRCAEAAAAIMSMMVGIHAEHRIAPGRFNRTQYSAMLYQMVELLLADFNQSGR